MDKLFLYMKEREGLDVIENEFGFCAYIISGDECYIKELFIYQDFRHLKKASGLADRVAEIAKTKGCKFLTGTVCPRANNSTESLLVLLGYGMKLIDSNVNLIIFKKDLGE